MQDKGEDLPSEQQVRAGAEDAGAASGAEGSASHRRFDGTAVRFAVGLICLVVVANLGVLGYARSFAGATALALELVYGVLFVVGVVLVASAYLRSRSGDSPAARAAFEEGVRYGSAQAGAGVSACPATPEGARDLARRVEKTRQEAEAASVDPVEQLLSHSDDVFASLRSLVENKRPAPGFQGTVRLLSGIGLPAWDDAPEATCRLLDRNGRYWIACETDGLPARDYDRMMAVEAALNLAKDVRHAEPDAPAERYPDAARSALHEVYVLPEAEGSLEDCLQPAYDDPAAALPSSEWAQRMAVAIAAENAPAPFRLDFDMRSNVDEGLVLIRLEVPRPACFSCVADSPEDRIELAKSYALRTALLMAGAAFRAPQARTVAVSCREHGSLRTVLSLQATRDDYGRLLQKAAAEVGWFDDASLKASLRDDGWFGAVEPHLRSSAESLMPERYILPPELDERPCSAALAEAAHVRTVADFGINEDAERRSVWHAFAQDMPTSNTSAVARFMELRDGCARPETVEACSRAIRALAEGTVDLSDVPAVRKRFFAGSDLDAAVEYAQRVMTGDDPEALGQAIDRLQSALDLSLAIAYLDDTDAVYRYFGSTAERVYFNRSLADGKRAVHLVPDVYFNALELAARMLTLVGRNDEALRYANEARRIAPASCDAALIKARVLENAKDLFGAVDMVRRFIPRATSHRDLSLLLYRLAYFEWKMGQARMAAACYKAVIGMKTSISAQAALEMAQMITTEDGASDLSLSEAHRMLDAEGISYTLDPAVEVWLPRCAILAADECIYPVAAALTGALVELVRDDALVDAYRSFLPDSQL